MITAVNLGAVGILLLSSAACAPVARIGVEQWDLRNTVSTRPDEVLYERALDTLDNGKVDVACLTLQTLINTYPESEYTAAAKTARDRNSCSIDSGMKWIVGGS